jgi:hypothetical protein
VKPDFEYVWNLYPKRPRGSKKGAATHFVAHIKTEQDMADILAALDNYKDELRERQTENQWIKDGKTWFNNFRDYAVEATPERPAQATLEPSRTHICRWCGPEPHAWLCEWSACNMPKYIACPGYRHELVEKGML